MKKSLIKMFLLSMAVTLMIYVPVTVHAEETDITEEDITEIQSRIDKAFRAGEASADLSDMDIVVNMYSDKLGEQYQKILDLCEEYIKDNGCFELGTHREPYVYISPETEGTDECNEYGIGPNRLVSVSLVYDDYYCRDDGSADLELIGSVQDTLSREYKAALSVVSDDMSDVEKALALYDYIIAVSNYPDVESIDEDGIEVYDSESYSAVSVFRDHISVCAANATAYCYLLSDCGIPCIRVDSDEMQHSWTMLKVDGAWYHADPTWDDPKYTEGMTSRGEVNDDIWDLGACSHYYFLKSDEEMENRLGHYGWSLMADYTEDSSVEETPVSGPSGSFENTFFGDCNIWQEDENYNYINGSWYFLDRYSNRIVRTVYGRDMNEADYIEAPSENTMKYVFGSGDSLFICENSGIWRYDTGDGKMEKLDLAENHSDKGEPVFTEMNIASGKLNGTVVYSYWSDKPEAVSYSYPVEELMRKKPEAVTEEPAQEPEKAHSGVLPYALAGLAVLAVCAGILVSKKNK